MRSLNAMSLRAITLENRTKKEHPMNSPVKVVDITTAEPYKSGIGTKYTGKPAGFVDTPNGVYWEAMYQLSYEELRIQRGLLKYARNTRTPAAPALHLRVRKYLTEIWGLVNLKN
jgi:hypothetical protein